MTQAEINNFDPDTFDWETDSWKVAKYCPEHMDKDLYNWKQASWAIAEYCPEHFDKNLYNWEYYSYAIAKYCPQHMNKKFINLKNMYKELPEYKGKTYEQIKTLAIGNQL